MPAPFRALLDDALLNAIGRMAMPLHAQASGYFLEAESVMLIEGSIMSNAAIPTYLEIIDFIAAGTTPQAIVAYRPSLEAQQRVAKLIAREKEGGLSPAERSELDHFVDLEHILRMAKGRARQILTSGS